MQNSVWKGQLKTSSTIRTQKSGNLSKVPTKIGNFAIKNYLVYFYSIVYKDLLIFSKKCNYI